MLSRERRSAMQYKVGQEGFKARGIYAVHRRLVAEEAERAEKVNMQGQRLP